MKYIKTKYGIIEKSKIKFLANGQAEITDGHGSWRIDDLQIVKESDDLKKLCDEYVLIDKNEYETPINKELIGKKYEAMFDEFKFRLSEGSDPNKMHFYGAIWTDKGLIYVAEVNEKGEWELL